MRQDRRDVPKYQPPVGRTSAPAAPMQTLAIEGPSDRQPRKTRPDKAASKPVDESAGQDDVTVSTRLSRSLVAKLDRVRKSYGGPVATRSAMLRWFLENYEE